MEIEKADIEIHIPISITGVSRNERVLIVYAKDHANQRYCLYIPIRYLKLLPACNQNFSFVRSSREIKRRLNGRSAGNCKYTYDFLHGCGELLIRPVCVSCKMKHLCPNGEVMCRPIPKYQEVRYIRYTR